MVVAAVVIVVVIVVAIMVIFWRWSFSSAILTIKHYQKNTHLLQKGDYSDSWNVLFHNIPGMRDNLFLFIRQYGSRIFGRSCLHYIRLFPFFVHILFPFPCRLFTFQTFHFCVSALFRVNYATVQCLLEKQSSASNSVSHSAKFMRA